MSTGGPTRPEIEVGLSQMGRLYSVCFLRTIMMGIVVVGCGEDSADGSLESRPEPSTGIQLSLTATEAAHDFTVGVDGGAVGQQPRVFHIPAGGRSVSVTLPVPEGGPYRIRAIARREGTTTDAEGPGWATGKVTGIVVQEGSLSKARLAVIPYTVSISTPIEVSRGMVVTVEWTYVDAGDALEDGRRDGTPGGRLYWSQLPFQDGGGEAVEAKGERIEEGRYRMKASFVAPMAEPGNIYFQVEGFTFGTHAESVSVSLIDPSRARDEMLRTLGVT